MAQLLKNPPAMQETWVQSLSWEDPLEKGKATHSSSLAWRIHGLYSQWGRKQSDMTEQLSLHFTSLHLFSFYLAVFTSVSLLSPDLLFPPPLIYHKWQREIRWHFYSIAWKFLALSIQPCCLKMCFPHNCRIQLIALFFLSASEGLPSSNFQ